MKKWIAMVGALLVSVSLLARAQETPKAEDAPQIDQLLWMVGDWEAVEKADNGDNSTVHLKVRKSDNQQAMLYDVTVESHGKTKPKYTGMYYWHPTEKTFKVVQVDDGGNIGEGRLEQTGNRVQQLVKVASGKGDFELKSEWEIRPREFEFVAQIRPVGTTEWKPALDVTYSRVGKGALPKIPSHHHD